MEVLADATNTIAEGEVLQLLNCHDPDVDEEDYLHVIRYKTAKLFEAAAQHWGDLGEAARGRRKRLARYGMHLGTAFQLIDDVLDYSGDHGKTGKNLGDDLAEGKPTLPLIYAIAQGRPSRRRSSAAAIESGGLDDFGPVLEAIRETGALDYAREQAHAESQRARSRRSRPAAFNLPGQSATIGGLCGVPQLLSARGRNVPIGRRQRSSCRQQICLRGVAQPGRVLRSGRRSRRFESSHPDQDSFPFTPSRATPAFLIS